MRLMDPDAVVEDAASAELLFEDADLESAGYLTHRRLGRRNRYVITPGTKFRHRAEADHEIAGLLGLMIDRLEQE